jgi:hypothetical protein
MRGRFNGGKLGGRPFHISGTIPPRGLDVAHDEKVSRYRFQRVEAGEAVYDFTEERRSLEHSTRVIDVGGAFVAVPLPFFPKPKA